MLTIGKPNCCGDATCPIDDSIHWRYLKLLVGAPGCTNVLELTAHFDILQCRINYDGTRFRVVSPYVGGTRSSIFDGWSGLSKRIFRSMTEMLAYQYIEMVKTGGPKSSVQYAAPRATLLRLQK